MQALHSFKQVISNVKAGWLGGSTATAQYIVGCHISESDILSSRPTLGMTNIGFHPSVVPGITHLPVLALQLNSPLGFYYCSWNTGGTKQNLKCY